MALNLNQKTILALILIGIGCYTFKKLKHPSFQITSKKLNTETGINEGSFNWGNFINEKYGNEVGQINTKEGWMLDYRIVGNKTIFTLYKKGKKIKEIAQV